VQLQDLRVEASGDRRHERHLEGASRDDDLIGLVRPLVRCDEIVAVGLRERPHARVQLDWQLEALCVFREIVDDLVAARIAVWVAGERQARKSRVAR